MDVSTWGALILIAAVCYTVSNVLLDRPSTIPTSVRPILPCLGPAPDRATAEPPHPNER